MTVKLFELEIPKRYIKYLNELETERAEAIKLDNNRKLLVEKKHNTDDNN